MEMMRAVLDSNSGWHHVVTVTIGYADLPRGRAGVTWVLAATSCAGRTPKHEGAGRSRTASSGCVLFSSSHHARRHRADQSWAVLGWTEGERRPADRSVERFICTRHAGYARERGVS